MDLIALARHLEMLDDSLGPDTEDDRGFRSGFSARNPEQALTLPVCQSRGHGFVAISMQVQRGPQRQCADRLSRRKQVARQGPVGCDSESAGASSETGQVPRNSEPVTNSAFAPHLQHLPIPARQRNDASDGLPGETRECLVARSANRILARQFETGVNLGPFVRIIMHQKSFT